MSIPSALIALVFDDPYKADEARAILLRMEGEGLLAIDETAVISRRTEKDMRVTQDANLAEKGKDIGGIVGAIATAVFPLARPLGEYLGGRVADALDKGISNKFIEGVKKELQDGTSVLILTVHDSRKHGARIIERVRRYGPRVLTSELSAEDEAALSAALQGRGGITPVDAVHAGGS